MTTALALTTTGRLLSGRERGRATRRRQQVSAGSSPARQAAHGHQGHLDSGREQRRLRGDVDRATAGLGANGQGALGDGTTTSRSLPGPVKLPKGTKAVAATVGQFHVLALTASGQVLPGGNNQAGQLGDGSTTSRLLPVRVRLPKGTRVRALAAGKLYGMALTASGRILAWGDNNAGQLGTDSVSQSDVPVRVPLPVGFTPTAIGAGLGAGTALAIGHQMRS